MGWWKSEHGILGDHVADILDMAWDAIVEVYQQKANRNPTQGELANLVEFTTGGVLCPLVGKADEPWDGVNGDETYPRAMERGRQGIHGPFAECREGELVNVDPMTGDHYELGEMETVIKEIESEWEEREGEID